MRGHYVNRADKLDECFVEFTWVFVVLLVWILVNVCARLYVTDIHKHHTCHTPAFIDSSVAKWLFQAEKRKKKRFIILKRSPMLCVQFAFNKNSKLHHFVP